METTFSTCKIDPSFAPLLLPRTKNSSLITKPPQIQENLKGYTSMKLRQNEQLKCRLVMGCVKSGDGSLAEVEANIKSEQNLDFGIEGKSQEKRGIVELMECLESEAIMGEDEGKEASDYNRRAQIFDKSARVFQALKEDTKQSPADI